MSYPAKWGVWAVLAAAVGLATPAMARDFSDSGPLAAKNKPEFSQSAAEVRKGQLFVTKGLVCDSPSEVDAVITLARSGDNLEAALAQVNSGAELPRCIIGRMLIAKYVDKSSRFLAADESFQIHHVQIVGIVMPTPHGVMPIRLNKPLQQYVVSSDLSVSA